MGMKKRQMMDGNTAAAHVAYVFTEIAAIYPITPSSQMAELTDKYSDAGRLNAFGQRVKIVEMQSEGGAAGSLHGALMAGALGTTFTSCQGLLLMIPNMYKIAGEGLPGVIHVAARAVSAQNISIYGDHSDVMETARTGFGMLASANPQECMDLGAVSHLSAISASLPVLHFFDGFRTSHEIRDIDVLDYGDLSALIDWEAVRRHKERAFGPENPFITGVCINPDCYFQAKEATNPAYLRLADALQQNMDKINALTGRDYKFFNYYGAPDAERVLISMGSSCDVIRETVEKLCAQGEKVGAVAVHVYRPFSNEKLLAAIPASAKAIAVLDKTKDPAAEGEPLYLDVRNAFYGSGCAPLIVGGRYGLGGKDFSPADVMAVLEHLKGEAPKDRFTVGIEDDLTFTSIPKYTKPFDSAPEGTYACKLWGFGSDGTVGAAKNTVKIIGEHAGQHVQAYFVYDAKKSGGVTISHLRFGKEPIRSSYDIKNADFIGCHKQAYVNKYDVLDGIKDGGVFLLNCNWKDEELDTMLPPALKRTLAEKHVRFYTIDGSAIAEQCGMPGRTNVITQAAFFAISGIIPEEDAKKYLKQAAEEAYGLKGEQIVQMNYLAIEAGFSGVHPVEIPAEWASIEVSGTVAKISDDPFIEEVYRSIDNLTGDRVPVSKLKDLKPGSLPPGTAAFDKRGVGEKVPAWNAQECLQCNICSYVCPHAAIRPILLDEKEAAEAPGTLVSVPAKGKDGLKFAMAVSTFDCTGCGSCVQVCPASGKALAMRPFDSEKEKDQSAWEYAYHKVADKPVSEKEKRTIKGSQFQRPLFEFSGACAGCGETPYIKLLTQLFGERMFIANPAGCTSAYCSIAPTNPFTKNAKGRGPAWGFSLFEDCAEYGYGMQLYDIQARDRLTAAVEKALPTLSGELQQALSAWYEGREVSEGTLERAERVVDALATDAAPGLDEIRDLQRHLVKHSAWLMGGDGWAYDIGFGGLDHVLSQGTNINVLVLDNEVYANTGGQLSKSTSLGATASFAIGGKHTPKKDLGLMAMSYGYVYVAKIAMGADRNQTLKAILEAEAYPGPSLIIAYAPCINHGIYKGMGTTQEQAKAAVECGYWNLYRYNPALAAEGKNPFILDSKPPTADYRTFLQSESRFASLQIGHPDIAEKLFTAAEQGAEERFERYQAMAEGADING